MTTLSSRLHDAAVLNDCRAELRSTLSAALVRCAHLACDFQTLDADVVMTALRDQFDPAQASSAIQDAFLDGFHQAYKDCDAETLTERKTMPSGVSL